MITIPIQLQGCTFILLKEQGTADAKHPYAPEGKHIYVDAQEASKHPYNLGVACRQPLVVIDIDNMDLAFKLGIFQLLPTTFTVTTGSGGRHYYYYDDSSEVSTFHSLASNGEHYGELRRGKQVYVVGPGSIHPNGQPYVVSRDAPIAQISIDAFLEATQTERKVPSMKKVRVATNPDDPFADVKVTDIISIPGDARKTAKGWQFANPWHGSKTGKNFTVFYDDINWTCNRCNAVGNAARALALSEGITRDCGHKLTKEEFIATIKTAERLGLIDARPNRDIIYVSEAEFRKKPTNVVVTALPGPKVTVTTVESNKPIARRVA